MKCRVISKRSDVPGLVFRPFLSVPDKPVIAVQLQEMGNVEHPFASEGAFEGQVGSWKITYGTRSDGTLDIAICQDDVFKHIYRHISDDQYQKRTDVVTEASRIDVAMDIITAEGPSHGKPGDWLLLGYDGDLHFCDHETFVARYVRTADSATK